MIPYSPAMRAYVRRLLHRWCMADDMERLQELAQQVGVEIVGVRRLHLGDTHSPNFGRIEEMTLAEWQERKLA